MAYLPYHVPSIGEDEIAEVVDTLRSGWLTTGPKTHRFEEEFAEYVGAPHAVAVNSCTAGLHLALAALNIGPGDEVITSPLTFCATVNTILHVGATPVLADVDEHGNLEPASVRSRISTRTRCLVPVHLAGLPCRMRELWQIAREYNLRVVEDAAHAAGTRYEGRQIGAGFASDGYFSDASAFSFYATKNMTTGEGGMVTTHDADLAVRMRILALHGISKDAWKRYTASGNWFYEVVECGFKYNLSDIQSAIGIHQLRRLESFIEERRRLALLYSQALRDVDELELPRELPGTRHSWHLYIVRLRLECLDIGRDEFIALLREREIGTSVHFIPIPLHPFYRDSGLAPAASVPAAMGLYERIVSLPLYPGMAEKDIARVADAIRDVVRRHRVGSYAAVSA